MRRLAAGGVTSRGLALRGVERGGSGARFRDIPLDVAVEGACLANVLWMKPGTVASELGLGGSPPHEVLPRDDCGTSYASVVAAAVGVRYYSTLDLSQDFKAVLVSMLLDSLQAAVTHALALRLAFSTTARARRCGAMLRSASERIRVHRYSPLALLLSPGRLSIVTRGPAMRSDKEPHKLDVP